MGPHGSKMKNQRFCSTVIVILEINSLFSPPWLAGTQGCDSFPRHLDLALASKKTNEGLNSFGVKVVYIRPFFCNYATRV